MFWTLGLAHLIGDYPLQTDRIVRAKRHWSGLTLHVAIHYGVMLLLSGRDSLRLWPHLLALAAVHFAIDSLKNFESRRWPRVVVLPYVFDQILHIASIALVAAWIEAQTGIVRDRPWILYAAAFLTATHVWFITERIIAHREPRYRDAVETHRWSRQIVRALALSAYLLIGHLLYRPDLLASAIIFVALLPAPYRPLPYRRRMLVQDLIGPLILALLVFLLMPTVLAA